MQAAIPSEYYLSVAYPNPLYPSAKLTFGLPEGGWVKLAVYDLQGRLVESLLDGELLAGVHTVQWSADGLASGLYVQGWKRGGKLFSRKLTLVSELEVGKLA
jgi:hypothetical protein